MASGSYFPEAEAIIGRWSGAVRHEAVEILQEVVADAEEGVKQIIHESETQWGRERVAGMHGKPRPYPGRIESGDMIDAVDSRVEEVDEDVYEGRWGWRDPKNYYLIQEHGAERFNTRIAPMESLARTLDIAEDQLVGRMDSIGERQ